MKPDEMFVVALLVFCVVLIAGFAMYSRRVHAAAGAVPAVGEETVTQPADEERTTPPAARSADRRRQRGEPAARRR